MTRRSAHAHRSRARIALALATTILLGLATRRWPACFGTFVATHAGDVLWATALYATCAFVAPRRPVATVAAVTLALATAVELSQLAHPPWLEAVRAWPGMRLVLGYGFLWGDLVRYAVGVLLAVGLDRVAFAPADRPGGGCGAGSEA